MKNIMKTLFVLTILGLATWGNYFSTNSGISNIGGFTLYLWSAFLYLAYLNVYEKKQKKSLNKIQLIFSLSHILITIVSVYHGDFIMGLLFLLNVITSSYILKVK